jgi:hypothetical protein
MIMDEELERLKRLANEATPGPWFEDSNNHPDDISIWSGAPDDLDENIKFIGNIGAGHISKVGVCFDTETRDGKYIAAANPQVILALIERLERAERLLKESVE